MYREDEVVLSQYIPGVVDPEPILRAPLECSDNKMTSEFPDERDSGTTSPKHCGVRFRHPQEHNLSFWSATVTARKWLSVAVKI